MMSSAQIAQMNHHAFAMGYGANPGLNSHEAISGITPYGHGAGTQAGVGLVSGLASTANTLSLAGLGALGGSFLLNKLGVGANVARGLGTFATATGATLPMAASLGLVMPGLTALGGLASGAQQYARTQNTLDRTFGNRLGMGGAFGYGVGREDARQLTEAMRSLKAVPEMMTSMGELQDILDTVSTMGILKGVRDASEFKTKFTSMVHALRDMSRDLGTTMKEATALFSSSVGQGFMDVDQAMVNARMAKSGSAVGIGMDTTRMMGLQSGGAAFLRSMGADSRAGAFGARDFATSISVAQQQGVLSAQDVLTITGKTGEEGVADLSQSLMKAQVNLFQNTGAGRFLTAALAQRDERGMFTGGLNQETLKRLRTGRISGSELMRLGQSALSGLNDEQALSFTNAMERGLGASAGSLAGSGGSATALSAILDEMGADNDEASRALIRQMTGLSQRQSDVMLDLAKNAASINKRRNDQMIQAAVRDRGVSFFKESMLTGQLHHASTYLQSAFVDPFQRQGANMATRAGRVFDEMTDEFVGGGTADRIRMLTVGMPSNITRLMFGNPERSRLTQAQTSQGISAFFDGTNSVTDRDDASLEELMTRSIAEQQMDAIGGKRGHATRTLAMGALAGAMMIPGLNVVAGLTLATTAGFGLGRDLDFAFNSGDRRRALVRRVLGKRGGKRLGSFNQVMNQSFEGIDREAAMRRLNAKLSDIGSVSDLRGMNVTRMSEFIASLEGGGLSGLESLSAAGGLSGADAKNARDIAASFKALIASGATTSSADAENEIRAAFDGGISTLFNDEASTGGLNGAYFMSETSKSIALSGNRKKRDALIKLLTTKDIAQQIVRNKDNPDELQRISDTLLDGALSKEDLKEIAKDMTETGSGLQNYGGIEYDAFKAVGERIKDPTTRLMLDAEQITGQAGLDAIRETYGSAGDTVASAMRSGGLFSNFGNISSAIAAAQGGGPRLRELQRAMKQNQYKGAKESKVIADFEKMGITKEKLAKAGFVFDDTLTRDEQILASQLSAVTTDLDAQIRQRTSPEMQRAERLGLTPELQMKIAEQYEKAIEASEKSISAHTDAIVRVTDAVAKLQTTQTIGTEIAP